MNVGQLTNGILLRLSNYSASKTLKKPTLLLATLLIDVYGDMRIKPPGSYFEERKVAGPLPNDLPRRITSFYRKNVILNTKLYTSSASWKIFYSLGPSGSV